MCESAIHKEIAPEKKEEMLKAEKKEEKEQVREDTPDFERDEGVEKE